MPSVDELVGFFETLTPAQLDDLERYYDAGAYFKDPFNEVHGVGAIRAIFEHMFASLEAPRFVVTNRIVADGQAALEWEFTFRRGGRPWCIRGVSHLRFGADGRVTSHRDFWDAAEELYAKLPGIGAVVRWLTRQLRTPAG